LQLTANPRHIEKAELPASGMGTEIVKVRNIRPKDFDRTENVSFGRRIAN